MRTLETDACLPYHSPAERTVLGCQLGPACTSQGRGRHSQTQPESIQACNSVPFDVPHSSDFSQAEIAWKGGKGDRKPTRWVTWYHTKRKRTGRKKQKWSSEWAQSLICIFFVLNEHPKSHPNSHPQQSSTDSQLAGHPWNLCMSHTQHKTISHDWGKKKKYWITKCRPAFDFWNGALARTNCSNVRYWAVQCVAIHTHLLRSVVSLLVYKEQNCGL